MPGFDVEVSCPACGAAFEVPQIRKGRTEKCPVCREKVPVAGNVHGDPAASVAEPAPSPDTSTAAPIIGSEPEPGGLCVICLPIRQRVNPLAVAPVLCDLLDVLPVEIKMQLRRGQGVLADEVPVGVADEIIRRLKHKGIGAFAVDQSRVPQIHNRVGVVRVQGLRSDGIIIQTDARGTERRISGSAVAAVFCTRPKVVAGGPTELQTETYLSPRGGIRTSVRAKPRNADPDARCTILVRGKSGRLYAVSFAESEVQYSYLAERMKAGASQNFCIFVGDLLKVCDRAFFPASMEAVGEGDFRAIVELKKKEFDKYERWIRCCVARKWHGVVESR
jgi:hypothetical protein